MKYFVEEMIRKKDQQFIKSKDFGAREMADYTREERDTIAVGFKQSIGALRSSIRVVGAIESNPKYNVFKPRLE